MECFIYGCINTELQDEWNTIVVKCWVPHKVDRYAYHKKLMKWTTCNRCGAVLKLDVRELPEDFDCVPCPMVHFKDKSNYMCLLENNCFFISPSESVREWHGLLKSGERYVKKTQS